MKLVFRKALVEMVKQDRLIFIDVGARGGLPDHWGAIGEALHAIAFEADPMAAKTLNQQITATGAYATIRSEGVWDMPSADGVLNITRSGGCSSFYLPNYNFLEKFPDANRFDILDKHSLKVSTIDLVLEEIGVTPQFLKIDAQGGALAILNGSEKHLNLILGLELEVEMAAMYVGEPLFGDVDTFVRSRGFELVDLRPTYWRKSTSSSVARTRGQLIFGDALYMISPDILAERFDALSESDRNLQLAKILLCCAVYNLDEWAVDYLSVVKESVDLSLFKNIMLHDQCKSKNNFSMIDKIRQSLGLILKDIGDFLLESKPVWGKAEQRLGNKPRSRYFR